MGQLKFISHSKKRTNRFVVSLRITSYNISTEYICKAVNLKPRIIQKLGEARCTPDGKVLGGVYNKNYCNFRLVIYEGESIIDFLKRQTEKLKSCDGLFGEILKGGGKVEFFVGFFIVNDQSGFILDAKLMKEIGELGVQLSFDIYIDN